MRAQRQTGVILFTSRGATGRRSLMTALPQYIAANQRIGSALLGSILLHAAVVALVSLYLSLPAVRTVVPGDFQNPLRARLVAQEKTELPESQPTVQAQAPVPAAVPEPKPGTILSKPGLGPEPARIPESREVSVPTRLLNHAGEPGPPFGARLVEVLFTRPFPRRFVEANPQLDGQGYVRDVDLEERPRAIALVIPDYPSQLSVRRTEGWVTVAFFLDEEGRVVRAAPVEGSESAIPFEGMLADTLGRSTFTPGKVNGKPVKSIVFHKLEFNPEGWSTRWQERYTAPARPN